MDPALISAILNGGGLPGPGAHAREGGRDAGAALLGMLFGGTGGVPGGGALASLIGLSPLGSLFEALNIGGTGGHIGALTQMGPRHLAPGGF